MKTHSNNLRVDKVFWPSNVRVPVGSKKYGSFVDRLVDGCLKRSRKTLTISEKEQYTNASKWFVYGLLQSYFSLPSVPMAMPMSPIDYSKSAIYQMPFGFKILRKITEVAIELGICSIELGLFNPYGKGKISRLKPTGALLDEFHDTGIEWEYLIPPPKNQGVCMRLKKGDKEILYVERNSSREVARMQDAIFKINKFLSRQCIFIDLPNAALRSTRSRENDKVGSAMQYEFEYEDKGSSLNMQQVFLRRIFCRGSFDLGGRFYGGWWQQIKSKLRRRIIINGNRTVECDYSGLIISLLYAREGSSMVGDPYSLGSITDNKKKRTLVKKFLIASLNDESGNFRLSKAQLDYLGLSHSQLISLVLRKHTIIKDYFGSGIGLHMQYQDSKLAEKVILQMMDYGEVCLPIHDSFIVCEHAENLLQKVMLHEYQQLFGSSVKVRLDKGYKGIGLSQPRQTLLKPTLTIDDLIKSYQNHIESYSVVLGYFNSWESRNFSVEEIENRLCCLNENRSLAKDFGHSFHHIYQFNGIPELMRHLGMPHSSSIRETDLWVVRS